MPRHGRHQAKSLATRAIEDIIEGGQFDERGTTLTQRRRTFAERVGVSPKTLAAYSARSRTPSAETLARIEDRLGYDAAALERGELLLSAVRAAARSAVTRKLLPLARLASGRGELGQSVLATVLSLIEHLSQPDPREPPGHTTPPGYLASGTVADGGTILGYGYPAPDYVIRARAVDTVEAGPVRLTPAERQRLAALVSFPPNATHR